MQIKQREPSVKVKEDWKVIEEIDFSRLAKLSLPSVSDPVDLLVDKFFLDFLFELFMNY